MYAHLTLSRNVKVVLITREPSLRGIYMDGDTNLVAEVPVAGKVEARKVAAGYEARCWNF